eukprot:CAMPEP_0118889512 /NCGR_PEP_ID=MMETSP1166-20130328/403_1 /TAXON_ID=1104430 /ORGANISM="Chrysoreinhardia sp, Strain CCMP3193" /LENGTH=143 /DNA_ID=CAMNT_0006828103 /DNA_START=15 /DNA_END=447 /DNA_ORIENTATION=+
MAPPPPEVEVSPPEVCEAASKGPAEAPSEAPELCEHGFGPECAKCKALWSARSPVAACVCCLVEEQAVYFEPCGHFVCCEACARRCADCPICREKIVRVADSLRPHKGGTKRHLPTEEKKKEKKKVPPGPTPQSSIAPEEAET